ncbi:hypothetical protein RMCBS344292_15332 [Rhizopus microsporus]|nr:hypothetical protein RMCBS344292_15332 [Rhizopus microsporus]
MTIKPLHELKGHKAPVLTLDYSDKTFFGDNTLASGSEDKTCRLWDLRTNKVIKGIHKLDNPVTSVKFARKSDLPLFYLSSGNKVYVYDLRAEGPLCTMPNKTFEFSNDEINSIDVNENNKFLVTADDDGNVNIIDLGSDKIYKKTTKKHQTICMTTKFRPKKSWDVWSGGMDSKVYEWDFSRGVPTNIYDMNPEEPTAAQMFNPPFVYSLDITNDGKWVAASLGDTTIQMISPPSKKVKSTSKIRLVNGHNTMVNCMSFIEMPNQSASLISGAANGGLAIWTGFYNCTSTTLEPAQTFQVDTATMQKVNWLKAYHKDYQLHVAIAGVGSTPESGSLCIYALPKVAN